MSILASASLVHFFAVFSPGPGFLIVFRNSIQSGRSSGLWTAVGIGLGDMVLIAVALVGFELLSKSSLQWIPVVQILGASYLIYIGIRILLKLRQKNISSIVGNNIKKEKNNIESIRDGLVTTILNPKAIIYFLSLISQFYFSIKGSFNMSLFVSVLVLISVFWFSIVAWFIGNKHFKRFFEQKYMQIEFISGICFISLGVFFLK